jgi:hypothetical protein
MYDSVVINTSMGLTVVLLSIAILGDECSVLGSTRSAIYWAISTTSRPPMTQNVSLRT